MKYSEEMLLESNSGFMMPFALDENERPQITLDYGEGINPLTGDKFFHKGMDFLSFGRPLYAMATGIVIGVGNDAVHENYVICRYGDYEVKYGHIMSASVQYSESVVAGQIIAQSGNFVHIGVKFKSNDINPLDFMNMIYTNIMTLVGLGMSPTNKSPQNDINVINGYEGDQKELLELFNRYFAAYMTEVRNGTYVPTEKTEASLRNAFQKGAERSLFYEEMPTMANPLGLSDRSANMIGKIQNTLIEDFLAYVCLRHNIYLPSWDEAKKKTWRKKLKLPEQS